MIAFRQGLGEAGFEEGRNVVVDYRWASDDYGRLPELASELVQRRVNLIVSSGPAAAVAAKSATGSLPIVFIALADPVRLGLVDSLGHPRGNATGTASLITELDAKRFELLHELVPGERSIGLLVNPNRPGVEGQIAEVQAMADRLNRRLVVERAGTGEGIDAALASLGGQKVAALVVGGDPLFAGQAERIVALVRGLSMPTIYQWREFVEAGGLMSYGPSRADAYRLSGVYAGRVLRGERVADLPVLQPTRFEFVLNVRTAKELAIDISPTLLARADELLE